MRAACRFRAWSFWGLLSLCGALHADEQALSGPQPEHAHAAEAEAGQALVEAAAAVAAAAAAPLAAPVDDVSSVAAPVEPDAPPVGRGVASWYGDRFHGRTTASGEAFDMHALTAAHPTLPFGSIVRVRSLVNDRVVDVRINDRGPYAGGRIIDLSRAAAAVLGLIQSGSGIKPVQLNLLQGGSANRPNRQRKFFNARRSSPPPAR